MKVLVCGGRAYNKVTHVCNTLDEIHAEKTITEIISGNARGADQLSELWAKQNNVTLRVFPADWDRHGKRAGYLRNVKMLEEGDPDMVVAFPGGKGTRMMVAIAESADIPVLNLTGEQQ